MKNWKLSTLFKTPLWVVFALGLLIVLVELLIMSVIRDTLISIHFSGQTEPCKPYLAGRGA